MQVDTNDCTGREIEMGDRVAYMSLKYGMVVGTVIGVKVVPIPLKYKYEKKYKTKMLLRMDNPRGDRVYITRIDRTYKL